MSFIPPEKMKIFLAGFLYTDLEEGGDKNKIYTVLLELATIINTADDPMEELEKLKK